MDIDKRDHYLGIIILGMIPTVLLMFAFMSYEYENDKINKCLESGLSKKCCKCLESGRDKFYCDVLEN